MTRKEIWVHISPWLVSALISSAATFGLLVLFIVFPGIKEYITVGDDSLYYLPFIGAGASFQGTPLTFSVWTSLFYLVIGVAGSRRSWPTGFGLRVTLSNSFLNLAIAIFFFIIPLLSVIWALAIKDWNIAIGTWSEWEGNHGPWYRLYHLRRLLGYAFEVPHGSFYFAFLSFIVKRNKLASIVLFGSMVLFFSLIFTHQWLID
jgi:hypothetical protein